MNLTARAREGRSLLVPFALLALVVDGGAFGVAACSSDSDGIPRADAGRDSGDAAAQIEACVIKCEKTYASGVPKYDAIDTCWEQKCKAPCIDATGTFDAGGDAGSATKTNDGGATICGTDTPTFTDKACDDCVEAFCCPSWKGCYEDKDCRAFDECIIDCFP